ncbi:hypothetical protein N9164_03550 [Draconibacterium sp.]|nr:hypothetical protein [Draconibacterium sp.]
MGVIVENNKFHSRIFYNIRRIRFAETTSTLTNFQFYRIAHRLQIGASNDGLVVFDDCRAYFDSSLDRDLHSLLMRRRQQMIDIIAVGHGFTEVPPKMFTFATHFAVFKTIDNIQRRKNVLSDLEGIQATQVRINQTAQTKPHYFEILRA